MGGTIEELNGVKPSAKGIAAHDLIKINMLVGSGVSEPILLAGRKVVSLQSNAALTSTTITFQGTNFSSKTAPGDDADYKDSLLIPNDADFNDLYDASGSIQEFLTEVGEKVWALPNLGFPIWVRLKLSVLQTATFYLSAKG